MLAGRQGACCLQSRSADAVHIRKERIRVDGCQRLLRSGKGEGGGAA